MNILERLKKLILRDRGPKLLMTYSRTAELVTIGAVEAIIHDEEMFKKFISYESNVEIFGEDNQLEYITAVMTYAEFMKDKGIKFTADEKRRIKEIRRLLPKKIKKKIKEEKQATKRRDNAINKAKLYNIAQSILEETDKFKDFMQVDKGELFEGVPVSTLYSFFQDELGEFYRHFDLSADVTKNKALSIIRKKIEMSQGYRINPEMRINPDFENLIMHNIPPELTSTQLAFSLYNELNKRVRYDSRFLALSQDLTDEFASSIYHKPIDEITKQDNRIICKNWAELYAYFLTKSGYLAYVQGDGKHKWVEACIDGTIIKADATNATYSVTENSVLTDLGRSKLGDAPAGFEIIFSNDEMNEADLMSSLLESYTDYSRDDVSSFTKQRAISELMELIGDKRELVSLVLGVNLSDPLKAIEQKLGFINTLCNKSRLDNAEAILYFRHLFKNILQTKELKRAKLNCSSLYRELYEDCEVLPVVSLYRGDIETAVEDRKSEEYTFFMFEQDSNQLIQLSKEDIIDAVLSGSIKLIDRRKPIEGIPELEMPLEDIKIFFNYKRKKADKLKPTKDANSREEGTGYEY